MKIQEKDYYHGATLTQIVEHPSFTALNKVDAKYGHYIINHDIRLFVKYSTNQGTDWQFTFQSSDLSAVRADLTTGNKVFVCLVCGLFSICILNSEQVQQIIDLSCCGSQWIRVEVHQGGSMWIQGQLGTLNRAIPHNAFPDSLFC